MPTPPRKGPKRTIRTTSKTSPIRRAGKASPAIRTRSGSAPRGSATRGSARPPRGGPKARPIGDRPRLRGTKEAPLKGSGSLLVKKSDRPARSQDRTSPRGRTSTERPARRTIGTARPERGSRTPRPSFSDRKKFPPRKTGSHDRSSHSSDRSSRLSERSSAPLKLTTKASKSTRIPISKTVRLPIKKTLRLPIKKISIPPAAAPENKELRETIRLNKYIANAGITSRRKADELITQGAVTINGKVVKELGVQVKPYEDQVSVNGEVISPRPRLVYLLLNKPKDTITTTSDEKDRTTVLDYVQTSERVYPVGRLDRNTTGVLLLTNDGELTNRLTHPSFEIEREYHATLDKRLEHIDARKIAEGGIDIGEGDVTGPAELLTMESSNEVILKIREGKNREVRRIFETLGYEVEKLDRISFAGLTHRGMSRGESRQLTNPEMHRLKALAGIEM